MFLPKQVSGTGEKLLRSSKLKHAQRGPNIMGSLWAGLNQIEITVAAIPVSTSLVPRPRPPGEGKGLVTIARFLVCAESAVLFSRQPIRLLGLKISCDIKRP